MKIAVTGAGGMLARAIVTELRFRSLDVVELGRDEMDVTDAEAVERTLLALRPDVVFQGAAFTAVDDAERHEEAARLTNAVGAGHVARVCRSIGSLFVYPSTDYVFSAPTHRPRGPSDPVAPINAYGRTKLAGEEAARMATRHLIVRTAWLYGRGGRNFVDTISRLARERDRIEVVDDQIGIPTWTASLARAIADLIQKGAEGTFHATDGGDPVSWCGFAQEIVWRQRLACTIVPVPSKAFPRPAARPGYSVLDCSAAEATIDRRLPDWREMLGRYLEEQGVVPDPRQ